MVEQTSAGRVVSAAGRRRRRDASCRVNKVIPAGGFLHGHPLSAMNHFAIYVQSLGLPRWLGYVSALTEFVGGAFLIIGLLTRLAAFLICGNLLVALVLVNLHRGYAGSESVLLLIAASLMLVVAGSGALALDRRLGLS